MENKNCPNCGATYTLEDVKCPYCGTLYLDMGMLDLAERKPLFIRYRIPYNDGYQYITQCAIPKLENINISYDYTDCINARGDIITKFCTGKHMTTDLVFEAIPFGKEKKLFNATIVEKENE